MSPVPKFCLIVKVWLNLKMKSLTLLKQRFDCQVKRDRSTEFRATKRETEYDDDDAEMLPKKIEVQADELVEKCADRKSRTVGE